MSVRKDNQNPRLISRPTRKLPIFPSLDDPDFWWLIGYLQGDGSIIRQHGGAKIVAYSTDTHLIAHTHNLFVKLFSLRPGIIEFPKRVQNQRKKYCVYVCSRVLDRYLSQLGLKFGTFRWNVPLLPPDLFFSYLAGLFDAEGCTCFGKNRVRRVLSRIDLYSSNARSLMMIKNLLHRYGISSNVSCHRDLKRTEKRPQ